MNIYFIFKTSECDKNFGFDLSFHVGMFCDKGLSIYYVSSYNKAGSVGMLTNAYLREQGFIKKLMSYENQH